MTNDRRNNAWIWFTIGLSMGLSLASIIFTAIAVGWV